jgi:Calcineurin-like phosphoesterase
VRARRLWRLWWLWLVATSCTPDFPPHWVYTTGVDRTAATVVWTGTHGGTAECRAAGGAPVVATGVGRERGLLSARVESLTPGTRYACRILAPDGQRVARVHFRTAPADDAPLLFTVVGDSGHGGPVAKAIARRIRAAHPAFLIHVGDFAYNHGSRDDMKDRFFPPYRRTLRRVPIFPTPGNHDLAHRSIYRTLFAPASDQRPGDGLRYRFRWGPAAFVSIDSPDAAAGAPGLADDLAADGSAPWRIVFVHEPLYTAGHKRVERGLRPAMEPVVEAAGVDLVLAGHQHFYERSVPSCEFLPSARVMHVTSGGGSGTQLDPVRQHPNFPRALSTPHFLRVRVWPDRFEIRAISPEGHTLDRVRRVRAIDPGCRPSGWPRQHWRKQ